MKLELIQDLAHFKKVEGYWKKLYSQSSHMPFLSYEWTNSWIANSKINQLCILIFKDEENIAAILPLFIDSSKTLRFIGDLHADSLGILYTEDANKDMIIKVFLKFIDENKRIQKIDFRNLSKCWFSNYLFCYLKKNKFYYYDTASSEIYLEQSEDFFDSFRRYKGLQSELKRISKKFVNSGSSIYMNSNNDRFPLDLIKTLNQQMIESNARNPKYFSEIMINVCQALYLSDMLFVHEFHNENSTIALNLFLKNNNTYQLWIDLYSNIPYANIASYISLINELKLVNNKEQTTINFGRGLYKYKLKNFRPYIIPLKRLVYAKSFLSFVIQSLNIQFKIILKAFFK